MLHTGNFGVEGLFGLNKLLLPMSPNGAWPELLHVRLSDQRPAEKSFHPVG